jgi:hypothetical protein
MQLTNYSTQPAVVFPTTPLVSRNTEGNIWYYYLIIDISNPPQFQFPQLPSTPLLSSSSGGIGILNHSSQIPSTPMLARVVSRGIGVPSQLPQPSTFETTSTVNDDEDTAKKRQTDDTTTI